MAEFKSPGQLIGTGLSEALRPGPVTFDGFGPVPIAPKLALRGPRQSPRKAQVVGETENFRVRTGKQVYPVTSDGFGPVVTAPDPKRRGRYSFGTGLMSLITSQVKASKLFARQNRYDVIIPIGVLKGRSKAIYDSMASLLQFADIEATDWADDYYGLDLQEEAWQLMMYCEHTELPSYQFQMESNRHYGPSFKIPHKPEYQDITMTFMCGSEMLERYIFETWMYLVMDPETNNFNYIDEYALDIDIYSYPEHTDFYGEYVPNYSTTLVEAYPIAVNAQELAYDANNTIQKIQVTFTYKYAIPFTGKGSLTGRQLRGAKVNFGDTIQPPPIVP